ncbi:MAG: HlyD family efflux transporter periplasmic adaptor subunit, partial [Thermoguttaceae bacterium]|nr:HlyD family efflux transporter periplasmic adaptor subunit [Thermoguttaceae bacterium]
LDDICYTIGLEVDEILVKEGETIVPGQKLATVTEASAINAMVELKEQISELDGQLVDAASERVDTGLMAGVAGRVKAIYGNVGDLVADVMFEHGALALISLDGHMAVNIENANYNLNDKVNVVTSDGKSYTGTVSNILEGVTKILITDDGPKLGDTVTVDGTYTGTLEINDPLKVLGYAGKINSIIAYVENYVYATTNLMFLTDTSYTANYNAILKDRAELEDILSEVISVYKNGAILSKVTGTVYSIPDDDEDEDEEEVTITVYDSSDYTQELTLLTVNPDKEMTLSISVDETDILSLEVGQEVSVTVEAIGEDVYTGTVTEIDTTATTSSGVTYYTAEITLPKEKGMMDGMTATASVTVDGVENALILPADAVHKTRESSYVYTSVDADTNELTGMAEVKTGMTNGDYIEITEGLKEGDTVYYVEKQNNFGFTMPSGGFPGGNMPSGGGGFPGESVGERRGRFCRV